MIVNQPIVILNTTLIIAYRIISLSLGSTSFKEYFESFFQCELFYSVPLFIFYFGFCLYS